MVIYKNIKVDNAFTKGFSVSITEPLSLKVDAGTINYISEDSNIDTYNYNSFEFDVEVGTEYDAIFDVYLLEDSTVHVDRTEICEGTFAFYEGVAPIRHTLLSFTVPANTKTLNDIDILVNTLGGETNEDQSE